MSPYSPFSNPGDPSEVPINGVMIGIVTNNKDPEGFARVKLSLPIQEGNNETDWVRIATLMAGNDRGSLFIPEVGDEVLVAFHLGDIREPYVIGALWGKKDKAPKVDEKNNIRKFKSRSGHEITFDDDGKNGKVTVQSSKGHKLELDDKSDKITVANDSNNKIEINGSKNEIILKSNSTTISMDAKGEVKIVSNKKVSIKSLEVGIEAKGQLNLKGGAAVNIKSDGLLVLKGSMVKVN